MKKWPYILTILFLFSFPCLLMVPFGAVDNIVHFADYTLTFVIPFPPSDVELTVIEPERQDGIYSKSFCEGYYNFYFFSDFSDVPELTFKVYQNKYNKTPFEFTIEKPSHQGETFYTLDLSKQVVFEGTYPYRTALLVAIRVAIFFALEAFLLWAIGFKHKRNWLILLGSTLISQTFFNFIQVGGLLESGLPSSNFPLLGLGILAIIDMILFFSVISNEGNNRSTRLFIVSNLLRAFVTAVMVS